MHHDVPAVAANRGTGDKLIACD